MVPPWQKHPDIPLGSAGWRMGFGEQYWIEFDQWFGRKTAAQKRRFATEHPEPPGWEGFYRRKGLIT